MDTLTNQLATVTKLVQEVEEVADIAVDSISNGISANIHQQEPAAAIESGQPIPTQDIKTTGTTDDMLSCAMSAEYYKTNFTKMVLLSTFSWSQTSVNGTRLNIQYLPSVFFSNNYMPSQTASRIFSFVRCGFHFRMLVNASPGVLGSVIMVYIPGGFRETFQGAQFQRNFSSILNLPHTILDVRCSNEADLVVPYVSYRNYFHYTQSAVQDTAAVAIYVFSQMQVGNGFAGEIDISLYGEMIDADYQCPRPFDVLNQGVSKVVPPDNPPIHHHTMVDGAAGCVNCANVQATGASESIALVGESTAIDTRTAGSSTGISDFVDIMRNWVIIAQGVWEGSVARGGTITELDFNPQNYGNFGLILSYFQYYRGSINIKVMTYASPLATARYQLTWYPDTYRQTSLDQCRNGVFLTADIGCESGIMTIPFTSPTWRRQTNTRYGRLTMSCVNKIAYNTTAPNKVSYKILIQAGPDFQVFCPRMPFTNIQGLGDSAENPVLFINYEIDHIPIQSQSHSQVATLLGRVQHYGTVTLTAGQVNQFPIELHTKKPYRILETFAYWSSELLVSLVNHTNSPLYVNHKYSSFALDGSQSDLMAAGVVIIPAGGAKTINIPFYSDTPLRRTIDNAGRLALLSKSAGTVDLNIAFRNPRIFFPLPCTTGLAAQERNVDDLILDGDVEENPGPFTTIQTRSYGYIGQHTWVRDLFDNGHHSQVRVVAKFLGDQVFFCRVQSIASWFWVRVRVFARFNVGDHVQTYRMKFKISKFTFLNFHPNIVVGGDQLTTVEAYESNGVFWQSARGLAFPVGFSIEKSVSCIKIHIYPHTSSQPIVVNLGGWVPDLTQDGDIESNPGPRYWITDKRSHSDAYGHWETETLALVRQVGDNIYPCGPHIIVKRVQLADHRSKTILSWARSFDQPIHEEVFMCHRNCWVRDLTMDGDVESNPGPWSPDEPTILIVGPPQSGKTQAFHLLTGAISSRASVLSSHGRTYVDTNSVPNYDDVFSLLVYVFNPDISDTIQQSYVKCLDSLYPNWLAHTIIFNPYQAPVPQYLKHPVMGYIATNHQEIFKLIDEKIINPYYEHLFSLVYKDRGLYRHYGVKHGSMVYHLNTHDILKSSLSGQATVTVDMDDGSWFKAGTEEYRSAMHILNSQVIDLTFSIDQNCETWARDLIDDLGNTQSGRLKWALSLVAAMSFLYSGLVLEDQSPGIFTKLISTISGNFFKELTNLVVRTVIRVICRVTCYLILYCHGPNLLTTGVLVALISMDITSIEVDPAVQKACQSLVEGDFEDFCTTIIDMTNDPDTQSLRSAVPKFAKKTSLMNLKDIHDQSPKPFNEWSTAAKNAKWWIEQMIEVFNWIKTKLFPEKVDSVIDDLETKSNEIATIMALADEHICKCRTDKNYVLHKDTPTKHKLLVDRLVSYNIESLPAQLNPLAQKLSVLLNRLQSINLEPPLEYTHRVEPLGIWIQGAPGCGKSFLCHYIVKTLKEKYGWEPYAHPVGSDHMDGYIDQEIHVFDDLGQNREEEDIALMCNLISSVPFIVPKAALESKGCRYNAKVVIATTNKKDFSTNKLLESAALQRRFGTILEVRPREKYRREDHHRRMRFNAVTATDDGSLLRGECWEINIDAQNATRTTDCWQDLNPNQLIDDICREIDSRLRVCHFMNQGKCHITLDSDGPDMITDVFKTKPQSLPRFVKFVTSCIVSFKDFVERNRTWFLAAGAIGTIISLASFAIPYVKRWYNNRRDESMYGGGSLPSKLVNYRLPVHNQGPIDVSPVVSRLVLLSDPDGDVATGLVIGGKSVVTYGHDVFNSMVHHNGNDVNWPLSQPMAIQIDAKSMDLAQYTVETPIQFKNINSKIYDGDYTGEGYLVWKERKGYSYIPVTNIRPTSTLVTVSGTTTEHTYTYTSQTWKGLCGAVLFAIINGAPKILGIHVAGNKTIGMAARLFPMFNQGKVTSILPSKPYYQPRVSKFQRSPCYRTDDLQPAVLSRNDKRLEERVQDITKKAAEKYIGNTFAPSFSHYQLAKSRVTQLLAQVLPVCDSLTFDEAITCDIIPIDWNTSPGRKYLGRTKRDLVLDPSFHADVEKILAGGPTSFTCYLKDELRPLEKVKSGRTRAIEAGDFDYVIAWRMVMGRIVSKLFGDQERVTGFAPGLNPYVYWDSMLDKVKPNVLALDFKNYDGSLSPQIMRDAVEILSHFHKDPTMVMTIHQPTIYSTNYVSDEVWQVEGGMCSGSPATTTLNTIVNLLVNHTIAYSYGLSPDEVYIVAYGDDTILSTDKTFDTSGLPSRYRAFFGMNVTSSDKTSEISWVPKSELEFLKRTTTLLPGTCKIVGKLDLDNMLHHLSWTSGSFQQQLNSFYQELVLHGQETYDRIRDENLALAPTYNHLSYGAALEIMKSVCMYF